ncbi:hypothetical protein J6590_019487 [Homalodisca vitripennis]|nr:hypothetical protein J6590_019487 [Homalodisca vitripennis]
MADGCWGMRPPHHQQNKAICGLGWRPFVPLLPAPNPRERSVSRAYWSLDSSTFRQPPAFGRLHFAASRLYQ